MGPQALSGPHKGPCIPSAMPQLHGQQGCCVDCRALAGQQVPVPGGMSQLRRCMELHSSLSTPALPCLVSAAGPCLPGYTLMASTAQNGDCSLSCAQCWWHSRSSGHPSKDAEGLAECLAHALKHWCNTQQAVLARVPEPVCLITTLSSWLMGHLAEVAPLLQAKDWLANPPRGRAAPPARLPERPGLQMLPQHSGL